MPENKRLAEATYMKKKMYYNMRIKTVHRDAMNVIAQVGECMHEVVIAEYQAEWIRDHLC